MAGRHGRYVVGLIGSGIGTSLSPELHEQEADELGLRYIYQLIDIGELGLSADDVGVLVGQARRLGFRGLNITHPCKQAVVAHLDELSADAAVIGAVNTVVFTNGRAVGHNTDGWGFMEGFRRGLPEAPIRDVVLLGAGGAGAAVAQAMVRLGVGRLTLIDLDLARAHRVAAALTDQAGLSAGTVTVAGSDALADRLATADGFINATAIGMTPHLGMPLPAELLRPELWVADVIYRPLETELLKHARDLGCRTLDGGGMVAFQAAESLRLFTGHAPDPERMYRHLTASVSAADPAGGHGA
jgi:shikimate dehydrogenase